MKISAILACAGTGSRAGLNKNKLLYDAHGITVLERTLSVFYQSNLFDQIIITASQTDFEQIKHLVKDKAQVVLGGSTRTQSVKNALSFVNGDLVLIHDGARPFVSKQLIQNCIDCTIKNGSAIPVMPTRNTMIKANANLIDEYLGKSELFSVQTPQGFDAKLIKKAYNLAGDKIFNDDGQVYKEYIGEVFVYAGDAKNVKLTYEEDFDLLRKTPTYRFGTGFDCHELVEGRKFILGGIEIPHNKGLLGHSDADVLTHAIMDAILSALSLRDIGYHFSDKDDKYKDISSMQLLKIVLGMIKNEGYRVQSVSASIMAEKPKLINYIPNITYNLAQALNIPTQMIGLSATTLEGLGFVGREEGVCVNATAILTID